MTTNFFVEKTINTPEISFNKDTYTLSISHRCYPENTDIVFSILKDFMLKYSFNKLNIKIYLEYFNTASSKQILNILKFFSEKQNFEFKLYWYYESDDLDNYEAGIFIKNIIDCDIEFVEVKENL